MFKELANTVRFLCVDQVCSSGSGHLGMPLGMADCLSVLFKDYLVFDPKNPNWINRDRFVMSGGHGSSLLYSLLHLCGYEKMSIDELKNFRKLNSITSAHPEYNIECGIEMTTGPLGEGLASAVGMAIAECILGDRLGEECINHYTYVSVGDGDLMEGISHEACSLAGNLGLGKLIVLFDDNNITIDGNVSIASNDDIIKRFESYRWHTAQVDGHDEHQISEAIKNAKLTGDKPSIIFCKTKIGYGSCHECTSKAHSGALSNEQLEELKKNLSWNYGTFEIPDEILSEWRKIGCRNNALCEEWKKKNGNIIDDVYKNHSEAINAVIRKLKKEFFVSRPFLATRASSCEIIGNLCKESKYIISGSCDLGSSTGCFSDGMHEISKNDFSGNYINYGVREHAMGAIINGITLHGGLIAFGSTFFTFSDYMKPAIRLAAMMKIPSIYVFTHDSIGVGEDGATHQPVEQLAGLRSIPNLNVFRPADALEMLECWQTALTMQYPSALILTRQSVPTIRFCGRDNLCSRGGYLLHEDTTKNDNFITLIATGSELSIALEVRSHLIKCDDISVNLVSMPCWKLFDEQDEKYKKEILPHGSIKIAIEAASEFGWRKYIGDRGMFFGVNDFGKSCSAKDNFNNFGLNTENIISEIVKFLK